MGELSILLSGIALGSILYTVRYELTIVLPEKEDAARRLTAFTLAVTLVIGGFFLLLSLSFRPLGLPHFLLFFLIAAGSLLEAEIQILQYVLIRQRAFSRLSAFRIARSLSVSLLPVLFYFLMDQTGLIAGYLAGLTLAAAIFLRQLLRALPAAFDFSAALQQARQYWSVIKYGFPSGLLNALSGNAQPLFIAFLFSTQDAGYYFLAYRLLGMPVNLLSQSTSQVYYANIVEVLSRRRAEAFSFTLKTVGLIAAIVLPGLVLAFFIAPYLIETLFGREWSQAGEYIVWLLPLFAGKALLGSISTIAEAINRTDLELILNFFTVLVFLATLYYGYRQEDIRAFLIPYALLSSLAYLWLLVTYLRKLRQIA